MMRSMEQSKQYGRLNQMLTALLILLSMILVFCSVVDILDGSLSIVLALALMILNINKRNLLDFMPFAIFTFIVLLLFFRSGNTEARDFNAPIYHALKFANIMLVAAISIGMRSLPIRYKKGIFTGALAAVLISVGISLYNVIFINKYAIRYADSFDLKNCIDFNQYYGICLLTIVIACAMIHNRIKNVKRRTYCVEIALIACIALSLLTTGVLLTLLGILLSYVIYKKNNLKRTTAILGISLVLILVLLVLFREKISDLLYNLTEPMNWIVRDRIRSVIDMIFNTNHNLQYSYARRNELANYSITSFKKDPIFGVGYKGYGYGSIGCHQEWQDMLGVFGIVGTLLFVLLMVHFFNITLKRLRKGIDRDTFFATVISFVVLGFLNPCLSLPVLLVVFVLAPNVTLFVERKPRNNTLTNVER